MNKKILLYLALMAFSLYSIPNTVALFAGQHSSYSGLGVPCDKCHSDVFSQLQAGASYEKHRAAAANSNYTTYLSLGGKAYNGSAITDYNNTVWAWNGNAWQNGAVTRNVSLDINKNGIIDGDEICMLCHNATLTGSTTHSGIVIMVCDDDRCHGNRINAFNSPGLLVSTSNITAAGYNLSQPNVHQSFYLGASNQSSSYAADTVFGNHGNANGAFISRGHWTCEGCHTGAAVNVSIIQAPVYNHTDPNAAKSRY